MNLDITLSTKNMPSTFRPFLWNILGFQEAYAIRIFLGDKKRILVLGETSGRDSHFLRAQGKEVVAVDIALSTPIERLVIADVTRPLPFPTGYFDGVVMSEILEHLLEDLQALREVRRVLADDGVLTVSVPFYHEWPGVHLRLHSPSTIRALLERSGFVVDDLIERGAWLDWHQPIQLLCTVLYQAGRLLGRVRDRDEVYLPILRAIADHNFRARRTGIPRRPRVCHYGGYIKAHKGQERDLLYLQVAEFGKAGRQQAIPTNASSGQNS